MGDEMRENRTTDIDNIADNDTDRKRRREMLWTEDVINEELLKSAEEQPVPESLLPENIKQQLLDKQQQENMKKGNRSAVRFRHFTEIAAAVALVTVIGGIAANAVYRAGEKSADDAVSGSVEMADAANGAWMQEEMVGERFHAERAGELYHLASDYEEVYEAVELWDGSVFFNDGVAWDYGVAESADDGVAASGMVPDGALQEKNNDFSKTNVQQIGVDESDIIKTDGDYIYVVKDRSVKIIAICDGNMEQAGEICPEMSAADRLKEIYVDKDKLYLILSRTGTNLVPDGEDPAGDTYSVDTDYLIELQTYDISDRSRATLLGTVTQEGSYYTSRKVGDYVYLFTYKDLFGCTEENLSDAIPYVQGERVAADCIYIPEQARNELIAVSVNGNYPDTVVDQIVIMNNNASVYMGTDAIYLYNTRYDFTADIQEFTEIAKFSYMDGYMDAVTAASVAGQVEDTFAISEKEGYLRVLTTDWTRPEWTNQLFVLDKNLALCGEIADIATGESIYAARYLGDMAYFITYRNTDPLYIADLSDPENPILLGNVEISGFSDYLHPFGDGMLLGIGYETDENSNYEGVKLTMFDISNAGEPGIQNYTILSDMDYTPSDSYYKTVLISADKNLIGFLAADYVDGMTWHYFIYRWENGEFREVFSEDLGNGNRWGNSDLEIRGLYAGDCFYLVTMDAIRSYSIKDDFTFIEELQIK